MAQEKSDYIVQEDKFLLGAWRRKDETVRLTPGQAKYLAPPYGVDVRPVQPPADNAEEERQTSPLAGLSEAAVSSAEIGSGAIAASAQGKASWRP